MMRNQLAITGMRRRVRLFSSAFALSCLGSLGLLCSSSLLAQNAPVDPKNTASPASTSSNATTPPPAMNTGATNAGATNAGAMAGAQGVSPPSKAAAEMTAAMEGLKSEGKLLSNRAVAKAVRTVVNNNSTQHELAAPMGAKVIAVHKQPGDLVKVGDKIVTLELNGKQIPILAQQNGIMQTINISKGGVIGNSRPRAAKYIPQQGSILLTLRNI